MRQIYCTETRATRSQGGLSPAGRKRNLTGAFKLNERWRDRITGKRVLLIDDVFTTGGHRRTLRRRAEARRCQRCGRRDHCQG